MLTDRYDLHLTTRSAAARDTYVAGCDLLLGANAGADEAFRASIAHDDDFALAHIGLARACQTQARMADAKHAVANARSRLAGASERERAQVEALALVIEGRGAAALAAAREHLATFPRDAMVLAPCTGVFGLIGFSGRAQREQELAALTASLAPAYGDDWWFLAAHAFAQSEAGRLDLAVPAIERSLALAPRNANGAHIRAHLHYECGEDAAGLDTLDAWLADYARESVLHCHLSWHVALWSLRLGQTGRAWRVYRDAIAPGAAWGPPINLLTDASSFLWRAELDGAARDDESWRSVRDYALEKFSAPGVVFADVHVVLALGACGEVDRLDALVAMLADAHRRSELPAGEAATRIARGFAAFSKGDWAGTMDALEPALAEHERIGGSRAQRDIVLETLHAAQMRAGRDRDAERTARLLRCPRSGEPA